MIGALLHEAHESRGRALGATIDESDVSDHLSKVSTIPTFSRFTLNLFTPYSSILLVNPQPKREMNCASVLCRVFLFDENKLARRESRRVR